MHFVRKFPPQKKTPVCHSIVSSLTTCKAVIFKMIIFLQMTQEKLTHSLTMMMMKMMTLGMTGKERQEISQRNTMLSLLTELR